MMTVDAASPVLWLGEGRTTSGGGTICTLAADHGTDVVIYVRDGDELWEYSLVGGP